MLHHGFFRFFAPLFRKTKQKMIRAGDFCMTQEELSNRINQTNLHLNVLNCLIDSDWQIIRCQNLSNHDEIHRPIFILSRPYILQWSSHFELYSII